MTTSHPKRKFTNRLKFEEKSALAELKAKELARQAPPNLPDSPKSPSVPAPTPILTPGLLTSGGRDSALRRQSIERDSFREVDRVSTESEDVFQRQKSSVQGLATDHFGPGFMSFARASGAGAGVGPAERQSVTAAGVGAFGLRMSLTTPSSEAAAPTDDGGGGGSALGVGGGGGADAAAAAPSEVHTPESDTLLTYHTWAERRRKNAPVLPWVVPITPVQTEWRTEHVSVPWTQGKPFCCIRDCDIPCFTGPPLLARGGGRQKIGMKWLKEQLLKKPPFEACDCVPTALCPHWCRGKDNIAPTWRKVKPITTWQLSGSDFLRPPAPLAPPPMAPLPTGGPVCNVSQAPPHGAGPLPYRDTRFACRRKHPQKVKSPPSPALDKSQKGMLWTPMTAALCQELEPFQSMEAPQWMRRPYINVVGAVKDAGWQGESPRVAAREALHTLLGTVVVKGDDEQKKKATVCTECKPKRSLRDARQVWKSVCERHQPDYCCGVVTDWLQDMEGSPGTRPQSPIDSDDKVPETDWVRNEILGGLLDNDAT